MFFASRFGRTADRQIPFHVVELVGRIPHEAVEVGKVTTAGPEARGHAVTDAEQDDGTLCPWLSKRFPRHARSCRAAAHRLRQPEVAVRHGNKDNNDADSGQSQQSSVLSRLAVCSVTTAIALDSAPRVSMGPL